MVNPGEYPLYPILTQPERSIAEQVEDDCLAQVDRAELWQLYLTLAPVVVANQTTNLDSAPENTLSLAKAFHARWKAENAPAQVDPSTLTADEMAARDRAFQSQQEVLGLRGDPDAFRFSLGREPGGQPKDPR